MAALPRSNYLYSRADTEVFGLPDSTSTEKEEQPQLYLHTEANPTNGYSLAIPGRRYSRPPPVRTLSTPPASPTRIRSSTMGANDLRTMHNSGAITPPITPTSASHSKRDSASSDFLSTLSNLRRGDSTSSRAVSRPVADHDVLSMPGSTELIDFPYQLTDYDFRTDHKGRKKTIGQGAWSDVYLATPSTPKATDQPSFHAPVGADISPPLTPLRLVDSAIGLNKQPVPPSLYAVKVPAMTSAKKVLLAEARILSYLSRFPRAEDHTVPFYGLDIRSGSLVLKALDDTLEGWIQKELNTLHDSARAQKLVEIFPTIALALIDSLQWLQAKDCTHADIKPSNILISTSSSGPPATVYSDFSSTILSKPDSTIESEASPLGAGTWDYLDPALLSSSSPSSPSASTDLWSLAITLLFLVIGTSPYDAFKGNKYQQREMIKSGSPLQCMGYDDQGITNVKRLKTLSRDLGFDVQTWLASVLTKDASKRASIVEWREQLASSLAKGTAKI